MPSSAEFIDQMRLEIGVLESRASQAETQAAELSEQAAKDRVEIQALREGIAALERSQPKPKTASSRQPGQSVRTAREFMFDVLRDAERPLTAFELADRMQARGWVSEAKQPADSVRYALEAPLSSGEIVRRMRGFFELADRLPPEPKQQVPDWAVSVSEEAQVGV